jgi:adenylate cyclase
MIEIEKRYLAKYLPADLEKYSSYYLEDVYLSFDAATWFLRLRRQDDRYMITKKSLINPMDYSSMHEHTIDLSPSEYALLSWVEGRRLSKRRYNYTLEGIVYEIAIFDGDLTWFVLIDVEFDNHETFATFEKPDFCGADVTNELWVIGHMLAGKKYADISAELDRFGYAAIALA